MRNKLKLKEKQIMAVLPPLKHHLLSLQDKEHKLINTE